MQKQNFSLALVTGASSGIGYAICHLLASKGINLIISGRDSDRLKKLANELLNNVQVQICEGNLAEKGDREKIIKIIHEKQPDLIINNAGYGLYGEALTYTTEEQAKILEVNGQALLELTLEAARTLITHKKKGTIVNVSSVISLLVGPSMTVYAASKAFVTSFSKSLNYELKKYGINVLVSCPGMVNTNFKTRAGGSQDHENHSTMSAEFAAEEIWKQIKTSKLVHIFDWKYRLAVILAPLLPEKWIASVLQKSIQERHPEQPIIEIGN